MPRTTDTHDFDAEITTRVSIKSADELMDELAGGTGPAGSAPQW